MLRLAAILLGIAFIFAGVAGFLPSFVQNGLLFGYLEVGVLHNIVRVVCGILAMMAATSYRYTRWYFFLLGIVLLLAGIVGFVRNGDLSVIHVNMADNCLHIVLGLFVLYLWFATRRRKAVR